VLHRDNIDGILRLTKANAVISDAQPKLGRLDSFEPLDITLTSEDGAGDGVKDAKRC